MPAPQASPPLPEVGTTSVHAPLENGQALHLGCSKDADRGLPQHTNYEFRSRGDSLVLPEGSLSPEEQQVVKALDADGDGRLSVSEVIQGVKQQAAAQSDLRQLRRRYIGLACLAVLAAVAVFGLTLTANLTAKELFLEAGDDNVVGLVTAGGGLVAVSEAKVAVPLGLAPFLSDEQLQDIELLKYHDCVGEVDVWDRVLTTVRVAPNADEEEGAQASNETFQMAFLLASGREIIIDAEAEYLDFPEDNVSQELCGELQCAQLHLRVGEVEALQARASAALGTAHTRRLRRQGGHGCRSCSQPPRGGSSGKGGPRAEGGRRRRREAVATTTTTTTTTTPSFNNVKQAATWHVGHAIEAKLAAAKRKSRRELADLEGGFVRLAFHDAATAHHTSETKEWQAGADGCVDHTASESKGLSQLEGILDDILDGVDATFVDDSGTSVDVKDHLSKADVWTLAAIVAVEFATGPRMDFKAGRHAAASCALDASLLPDAEEGAEHIVDVFAKRLGFAAKEIVALMGAHVLGRAERQHSGYSGSWVANNDVFSNQFFVELLDLDWRRRSFGFGMEALTTWEVTPRMRGAPRTIMLNTDMALAFDLPDGTRCVTSDPNGSCQRLDVADADGNLILDPGVDDDVTSWQKSFSHWVGVYSEEQDTFFAEFAIAFEKLMLLGATPELNAFGPAIQCVWPDCKWRPEPIP